MARIGIYRVLEIPWVYDLVQHLFAPGHRRLQERAFARIEFDTVGPVLDVGCGPRLKTPDADLVFGTDVNADYIRQFTGGAIDVDPELVDDPPPLGRRRLGYVSPAESLPFADGRFAEVRCRSLLHHLPHEIAVRAIREMVRCTAPGGRVILIDPVWPRHGWLRPLPWLIMKLDRGEWVRTEEDLLALAEEACPGDWSIRRYLLSYHATEGAILVCRKPDEPIVAASRARVEEGVS
jgi:SAM-dependent methyltransferase